MAAPLSSSKDRTLCSRSIRRVLDKVEKMCALWHQRTVSYLSVKMACFLTAVIVGAVEEGGMPPLLTTLMWLGPRCPPDVPNTLPQGATRIISHPMQLRCHQLVMQAIFGGHQCLDIRMGGLKNHGGVAMLVLHGGFVVTLLWALFGSAVLPLK